MSGTCFSSVAALTVATTGPARDRSRLRSHGGSQRGDNRFPNKNRHRDLGPSPAPVSFGLNSSEQTGSAAPIGKIEQSYFDNFHIQKLRSTAITAKGPLIQSGIVWLPTITWACLTRRTRWPSATTAKSSDATRNPVVWEFIVLSERVRAAKSRTVFRPSQRSRTEGYQPDS